MSKELWQLLALYLATVNLAAFALMGADKRRARRGPLAHFGKGPVPPRPVWGRPGRAAGDAAVPPQDPALVLSIWISGPASAPGRGAVPATVEFRPVN